MVIVNKQDLPDGKQSDIPRKIIIKMNGTIQIVYIDNAQNMKDILNDSVHLMVTSPPYFDAKMYSNKPIKDDLGNIHDLEEWFEEISKVWAEVYRVLEPGRKAFINIMNLPVRRKGGFRSLNLAGRTIDICESIGFTFKRDIVWHKTNAVKAHFGTYPYPGGILINNMHEFILEFEKPAKAGFKKYAHLTQEQREQSKLDKDFWLSIKKSDVWIMKPQGSGDNRKHVAPFPYQLPYRLIKAYSFVGEAVLDPFLGSGIALKAAIDLKRNGIGYEINPDIAQEAIAALRTWQGQMNLEE
jgi:DNA modification methylase